MTARKILHHILLALLLGTWLHTPAFAADRADKASAFYENALVRMERNDAQGAIIQLKNALQNDPRMVTARLLIGQAYLKAGQPGAAERSLVDAEKLGVDRTETALLMAEALFEQGKFRAVLDRGMTDDLTPATQVKVLTLLGRAHMELNEYEAAGKAMQEAESIDPAALQVVVARATLALNQGQIADASRLAERAVVMDSADASAWNILASVRHVQGDTRKAQEGYTRALTINPQLLDARIGRISLNMDTGNLKAAGPDLAYIQKAKIIDPRASYLLAMWFARQGKDKSARDYLFATLRAVEMVPPEILKRRSQILMLGALANYGLRQPEKAKTYLADYIALHPKQLGARKLLASIYLAAGDNARVVDVLLPVQDQLPGDPDALTMMANAYMALNRHATAAALLEEGMRQSDAKPLVQSTLGFSLLASGREDLGIQQLQKAFARDAGQARAGMVLVTNYLKHGQIRQAREAADRLVDKSPNNLTLLNLQGVVRGMAGDRKGARQVYEQILSQDRNFQTARLNLGRLDRLEGDSRAARARFVEALKIDPKLTPAMNEMASLEEAAGNTAEAVRWLEKARVVRPDDLVSGQQLLELHLRNGKPDLALAVAKELRAVAPDNMDVQAAYGRAQMALGQIDAAKQTFQGMTRRAGFDVKNLHRIALLQIAAGDRAGAEYSLKKIILQQETYLPAHALLADLDISAGNYASAETRIQRLLKNEATKLEAMRLQAEMYMRQGRYDQAVSSYQAVLGKADTLDNALGLYRAWQAAGKRQEAMQHMEAWNRAHPGQPAAQAALAESYLAAGRYPQARQAYERILLRDKNDPAALNNLANVLLRMGDSGAQAMAERAYKAAPQDANAADTLGLVLLKSGQAESALKYLREARIREPKNAAIREHLAQALELTGRAGEARDEWRAAQSLRAGR